MPLPGSRDYDAVDTGPLPHMTVNAIQDGVVDHETRIVAEEAVTTGHDTRLDDLESQGFTVGCEACGIEGTANYNSGGYRAASTGVGDKLYIDLRPPANAFGFGNEKFEIKKVICSVYQAVAGAPDEFFIDLQSLLDYGAVNEAVQLGTGTVQGNKLITFDSGLGNIPMEILLQYRYRLVVQFVNAGDRFYEARVELAPK